MENLQKQIRDAYNYFSEHMDQEQMTAFYNELTPEEIVKFNMMNIANEQNILRRLRENLFISNTALEAKNAALNAELDSTRKFAIVVGLGLCATLVLFDLHLYTHELEARDPVQTEILTHMKDFFQEKTDAMKTPEDARALDLKAVEIELIESLKVKGFTKKRWMRKLINKVYGEKIV